MQSKEWAHSGIHKTNRIGFQANFFNKRMARDNNSILNYSKALLCYYGLLLAETSTMEMFLVLFVACNCRHIVDVFPTLLNMGLSVKDPRISFLKIFSLLRLLATG